MQISFSLSEKAFVAQPRETVVQKIRMFAALGMYPRPENGLAATLLSFLSGRVEIMDMTHWVLEPGIWGSAR